MQTKHSSAYMYDRQYIGSAAAVVVTAAVAVVAVVVVAVVAVFFLKESPSQ